MKTRIRMVLVGVVVILFLLSVSSVSASSGSSISAKILVSRSFNTLSAESRISSAAINPNIASISSRGSCGITIKHENSHKDAIQLALDSAAKGNIKPSNVCVGSGTFPEQLNITSAGGISLIGKGTHSNPSRWLSSKCLVTDELVPYSPWIQQLREFVNEASVQLFYKVSGEDVQQIVKLIPELASSSGVLSDTVANTPEGVVTQRTQFFQSLVRVFGRLAKESQTVLFFDDLQWADSATMELLKYFENNALSEQRILVIAACRDFEAKSSENQGVADFIRDFENDSRSGSAVIHLQRFDRENLEVLLSAASKQSRISNEFGDLILSRTGGNLLFVEELLKSLFENGSIFANENGQWSRKPLSEIEIPRGIVEVIRGRLLRISPKTREILRNASVIGETFELKTLTAICNMTLAEQIPSCIDQGIHSGLLLWPKKPFASSEEETLCFSDESIHDVLYQELSPLQVKSLHLAVGNALEQFYLDSFGEKAGELAFHFAQAGEHRRALEYSVKAGDNASKLYAHEEASKYYELALKSLDYDGIEKQKLRRAELLSQLGLEKYYHMGGSSGTKFLEEAIDIFEREGEKKKALANLGRLLDIYFETVCDWKSCFRIAQKIESLLDLVTEGPLKTRTLPWAAYNKSLLYEWVGERENALEWLEKGRSLSKESQDPWNTSYSAIMSVLIAPITEKKKTLEEMEKAFEFLLGTKQEEREAISGYFHRALAHNNTSGPSEITLKLMIEADEFVTKRRYFDTFFFKTVICEDYLALGQWQKALEIIGKFSDSLDRFPENRTLEFTLNMLRGRLFLYSGELENSEICLRKIIENDSIAPDSLIGAVITPFADLTRLLIEKGELEEAASVLERGRLIAKGKGLTIFTALRYVEMLSIAVDLDFAKISSLHDALSHIAELRDASNQVEENWATAYLSRAEGKLALNQIDYASAITLLSESLEIWKRLQWAYEEAKTNYTLATVYESLGDLSVAERFNERATEIFNRLGAKLNLRSCDVLKRQIESEALVPRFEDGKSRAIFDCLVDSYFQDNLSKNLNPESSGWRTLGEIAKSSGLATSTLYGKIGGQVGSSPIVKQLLSSGFVESKTFSGERGRGGDITRFRICHEKEEVQQYAEKLRRLRADMLD